MHRSRLFAFALVSILAVAVYGASRITIMKMGGDIIVDDAPLGANLNTMGGDIRIGHARGEVSAKTMGGKIEVSEIDGSLDARSMGGSIRVRAVGAGSEHNLTLRSMGGSIELTVPRDFNATFDIEIADGHHEPHTISSDFPLQRSESDDWSFFNGRTHTTRAKSSARRAANRVEISTHGGNVTIHKE